ncbi:twin-arginine translocase TatA/TatE family subunit [Flavobacterium sp. NST-5]|uniref:Sec-independent protein translocase protein TatA n=1 Tax=Flavobacterium ichthyis TaxID=2698827 RepID=A0ABW9ZB20_9FLAO|nr:twin-arginine translocase TatA/TatE family subunit [Flavobacterium ichthyis]NBL65774.1 twin-arginine translocase TatA/TatE family subunit [Flavobacterium ichthyis]
MTALHIFLGQIGTPQIILIVVVLLLIFGGKKIPELMKGLGSGMKEFKNAAKDDQPANPKKEEEKI